MSTREVLGLADLSMSGKDSKRKRRTAGVTAHHHDWVRGLLSTMTETPREFDGVRSTACFTEDRLFIAPRQTPDDAMKQTRSANPRHFKMKSHIGTDTAQLRAMESIHRGRLGSRSILKSTPTQQVASIVPTY